MNPVRSGPLNASRGSLRCWTFRQSFRDLASFRSLLFLPTSDSACSPVCSCFPISPLLDVGSPLYPIAMFAEHLEATLLPSIFTRSARVENLYPECLSECRDTRSPRRDIVDSAITKQDKVEGAPWNSNLCSVWEVSEYLPVSPRLNAL